jgi:hypothetical protein
VLAFGAALAAPISPPTAEDQRRLHQVRPFLLRRRRRVGDKRVLIDARSLTNHDAAESLYIATDPDATSPRQAASPANRGSKSTPGSLGPIAPNRPPIPLA